MLGRFERGASGEAKVEYGDGTMRIVKPGRFVRCAVTGEPIALDDLRYKARLNDLPSYDQVRRCLAKLDKRRAKAEARQAKRADRAA